MQKQILVIDPESAGRDLVLELRKRDINVVLWWQDVPFVLEAPGAGTQPTPDLVRFADLNRFDAIIPGGESGVSAAEWLSDRAGLPASDPAFIHHRRDKDGMLTRARARAAGLRTAESFVVTDIEQLGDVRDAIGLPVIVKPSNSAGSDLVRRADSWAQAAAFVNEVMNSVSILNSKNTGAVVQEFIDGPQYHVNTVIIAGVHVVTEVYSNLIRDDHGAPQLYAGRTYSVEAPDIARIVQYTIRCMDSLGVRVGATHSEVRLTSRGPVLVEFNGRLMGPVQPTPFYVGAQGYSQATTYADVLAGLSEHARSTVLANRGRSTLGFYMLSATRSGVISRFDERAVRAVPSFKEIINAPSIGSDVVVENRTTTAELGLILLSHPSAEQLDADLARLEVLEREGAIYQVSDVVGEAGAFGP